MKSRSHELCGCYLAQRGPHWGLYCRPHHRWIKWVTAEHRALILDAGVAVEKAPVKSRKKSR